MKASPCILGLLVIAGCGGGGMSTSQIRQAAVEHTRETLSLGPDAKLAATTFVGREVDGKTSVCGFVRGTDGQGRPIDPREFIATLDPLKWQVFKSVHTPPLPSQPGKFVEWSTTCGPGERV